MKLNDILKNVTALETGADGEMEITGVSYDSRATQPGDVFVAIRGFDTDGHRYIPDAVKKGAVAVICEEKPGVDIPYVLVENSRYALAVASRDFFGDPESQMTIIGITGTNGKTTSAFLLKHLLETRPGYKVGLVGTVGNMIGGTMLHTERTTPESYELQKLFREMLDAGCTHVVMEVSSHSLVLKRVAGIKFAVGAFTNLTQDHLDFHRTMEDYAAAKALLFGMCERAAVNQDDAWAPFMLERAKCPMFTFSEKHNESDLVAKDIRLSASGVQFRAIHGGEIVRVALGIPGLFSVYNALGVLSCALLLGIPLDRGAEALSGAGGVKGRVEVVPADGDYTILIDYAHTPDAIENVLRSMRAVAGGRIVILFGCGGDRDRAKRPIMGRIAADNADFVIVTSDNPRTEDPEAIIAEITEGLKGTRTPHKVITDRRDAIEWAIENHRSGDVIILAGKGHEDYQIIGRTKHHMDEREIVAEILEKRKNNLR